MNVRCLVFLLAVGITASVPSHLSAQGVKPQVPEGTIEAADSELPVPQAFGDSAADLVFVPVAPCRIINTTVAGGIIAANSSRNFYVNGNTAGTFEGQGGTAGGCGIPDTATAVVINYIAVGPAGPGDFRAFPWAAAPTPPLASVINYANVPGLNVANAVVQPVCNAATTTCTFDLIVQADAAAAHLVADVTGYFKAAPTRLAYAWSCSAAQAVGVVFDVTANCGYSFNPSGSPVTVTRSATGAYSVSFPGLAMTEGHVQVTGYGGSANACKVSSWGSSTVFVRCFTPAGAAVDDLFTVLAID